MIIANARGRSTTAKKFACIIRIGLGVMSVANKNEIT
jgi:hypothetical protein